MCFFQIWKFGLAFFRFRLAYFRFGLAFFRFRLAFSLFQIWIGFGFFCFFGLALFGLFQGVEWSWMNWTSFLSGPVKTASFIYFLIYARFWIAVATLVLEKILIFFEKVYFIIKITIRVIPRFCSPTYWSKLDVGHPKGYSWFSSLQLVFLCTRSGFNIT